MSTGPAGRPARYPPDRRAIGEIPGYEFETPRATTREGRQGGVAGSSALAGAEDPLRYLRPPGQAARKPPSLPARVAGGALAAMLARNWVTGLALPILAAILVGVAAVVAVGGGGGGGTAPSALDAGFPPARLAGTDFTGATVTSPAVLAAVAASAGTEVAAGSAGGGPALWVSANGGSTWARAALTGAAALTLARNGSLAGVARGAAGWLAVGSALSGPIVARSPDGQAWSVSGGRAALPGASAGTVSAAVAAGPAGYVIVGHQSADGTPRAVAWYAPGAAGWRRAMVTRSIAGAMRGAARGAGGGAGGAQEMNAVTVTARGFAAVGSAGAYPAAWLSAGGRTWRPVTLPLPVGASHAAFGFVAASGTVVVAVGTEVSPAGDSSPFAEVSADGGATWRPAPLPVPAAGTGAGTAAPVAALTVTALTAAGGGFTATGTYGVPGGADVVVWTLPPGAPAGDGWTAATPQGTGLAGPGTQAITALTAEGATLTGVGFTAVSGVRQPTLWQSPIRN